MDAGNNNPNSGNNNDNSGGNSDGNMPPSYDPAEKEKWTSRGYNYMVHWYRQHPEEIAEIMSDEAEHDAEWYQQNPEHIGDLVRNHLEQERKNLTIDAEELKQEFTRSKKDELTKVEQELDEIRPKLAELSAKSRTLFIGPRYRAKLQALGKAYGEKFDDYLKIKSEITTTDKFDQELGGFLESRVEQVRAEIDAELAQFAGGDLSNTNKSKSEIKAERLRLAKGYKDALSAEYFEQVQNKVTEANVNFLGDYLEEATMLEVETNHTIDKGNKYRKFVHYIINNKKLKNVLAGAAVAGLAATGIGLFTGAIAVTSSYTLGGVALGALKGAIGGFIGSRQDSKTSKVRGFVNEEQIKEQLEKINTDNQSASTKNVTDWLLGEYYKASEKNYSSNKKRTLVATGLGALFGGIMSGVHLDVAKHGTRSHEVFSGKYQESIESGAANIDQVDVGKGKGLYEVFQQMGGNETNQQRALEIAQTFNSKYGVKLDASGISERTAGSLADIYQGKISDWPEVAQSYITEISEAWAREGLVPPVKTIGAPKFNIVTKAYIDYVPNAIINFLTRHVVPMVGGGILGGEISEFRDRTSRSLGRAAIRAATSQPNPSPIPPQDNPNASLNDARGTDGLWDKFSSAEQTYFNKIWDEETPVSTDEMSQIWSELSSDFQTEVINQEKGRQGDPKGRTFREWLRDNQHVDIQP